MNQAALPDEPLLDRVICRSYRGTRVASGARHQHDDLELTWVESGRLELDLGRSRNTVVAGAGACVLVPVRFPITPHMCGAAVLRQVAIAPAALEPATAAFGQPLPRAPLVLGAGERTAELVRLFMAEAGERRFHDDRLVASLHQAVVYALARAAALPTSLVDVAGGSAVDGRIRRALDAMAAGYRERLSVDELAAAAGMTRFPFLRAFRAQLGASPYRYLTGLRLERAAERLRAPSRPSVLEVALDCGFSDPGRFARAFRDRFGCTPRAWRARR